jgi:hypothetical protein
VDISIIKGASLSGKLVFAESTGIGSPNKENVTRENIIVELKTRYETFRVTVYKFVHLERNCTPIMNF